MLVAALGRVVRITFLSRAHAYGAAGALAGAAPATGDVVSVGVDVVVVVAAANDHDKLA